MYTVPANKIRDYFYKTDRSCKVASLLDIVADIFLGQINSEVLIGYYKFNL